MDRPSRRLKAAVLSPAAGEAASWFRRVWPARGEPFLRFRAAFAGAGRRLGRAPLEPDEELRKILGSAGFPLSRAWPHDELGRIALLARALEVLPTEAHGDLVRELYRKGDAREQEAVLRALPLLPHPARFVEVAVDACRTNVRDVFEAIACENPYPADHFAEPAFNQLVVKALFVGARLARVVGLSARTTPALRRMVADFASERRTAGRPVPSDVGLVLGNGAARE